MLNDENNKITNSINKELQDAETVSLTLDCWTSIQNYPYLGVTCHFLSSNLKLFNRTLCIAHLPGSHQLTIGEQIKKIFQYF